MNFKSAALSLALGLAAFSVPMTASAHTVLGDTVHLDLSAGSVEERVVGNDSTNVSAVQAHLYSNLSKHLTVYVNGNESYVSHSGLIVHGYDSFTGAVGGSYRFNNRLTGNVELGNRINDQEYLAGSNRTIPYVGVSLTHHVF